MRVRFFLVLSVLFVFSTFPVAVAGDLPEVAVVPPSYDFGKVSQGDLAIARFQIKNSGESVVTIQWMEFSEQGLIAQVSPSIQAGKSVDVLVNWNTSNFEGDISGEVILGFDHPEVKELSLHVTGTVEVVELEGEN